MPNATSPFVKIAKSGKHLRLISHLQAQLHFFPPSSTLFLSNIPSHQPLFAVSHIWPYPHSISISTSPHLFSLSLTFGPRFSWETSKIWRRSHKRKLKHRNLSQLLPLQWHPTEQSRLSHILTPALRFARQVYSSSKITAPI